MKSLAATPALFALALALVLACAREEAPAPGAPEPAGAADARGHTAPSAETLAANAAMAKALPRSGPQHLEDSRRGLVASDPELVIEAADGRRVVDTRDYAFVEGDAPPSVNPSLWRQAKLNAPHGLFEVAPGIHQVRGYDIANLTVIQGKTGWILVDPLGSRQTATAALALARRQLGNAPIVAVILTHSHVDHFGGIDAVLADPSRAAELRVVAPKGFLEEATNENVLAGVAMGRRATFQFGTSLERSPRGHVDTGLGRAIAAGTISILEPTDLVDHTPQEMEIDGVRFVFQYAPASEAPAELTFYLPEARAFCSAEVATHTLHNLYTLRGAKVRDALRWSGYIDQAIGLFGDAEVVFASHQWPVWGNARVITYLGQQRDTYRYLHDQTVRIANEGQTSNEIAEELALAAEFGSVFA